MSAIARERSDAELLALFAAGGTEPEAAFRELVARHGPMVLGVCRRLLGDAHAAEDAFQATFLVLARRAREAPRLALGVWLYGVARRVAMKAQVANRRRVVRERRAAEMRRIDPAPAEPPDDLKQVIDEELERLPEPLRAAVVLCDLGGQTRRQAAEQLGCPEGTLSSRLAQAREILARRLSRRGITPGLAGLAGLAVAVPAALLSETAAAGATVAAGGTAAASPAALALADEGGRAVVWVPQVLAGLVVALAGALSLAMSLSADPALPPPSPRTVWLDPFDGRLALDWKPLRPDPAHVSLGKHPGALTITTQRGTIYGSYRSAEAVRPRNVYLIDNPLPPGTDFTLTTRVVGFRPNAPFQQAGLVLYDDDDNYLKYVYEYEWMVFGKVPGDALQAVAGGAVVAARPVGECFAVVHEVGGKAWNAHAPAPPGVGAVWLRVTYRGGRYDFAFSTDGERYVTQVSTDWPGGPRSLGLIAKNGGIVAPEIDARFDFFELKTP